MFGMYPEAWLKEHHREHRVLVEAALNAQAARDARRARIADRVTAPAQTPVQVFGPACEPAC